MKKLTNDMREQLRAPFPPEAIGQNGAQSFLSSIKAIYITERLNDVFGIGGWVFSFDIVKQDTYIVVQGKLSVEEYGIEINQFGGHKSDKIMENGYKSAVTDCLGKCASQIEIGIHVFKGLQSHTNKTVVAAVVAPPAITEDDVQGAQAGLIDCSNKDEVAKLWKSYPKHFRDNKAFETMFVQHAKFIDNQNEKHYSQEQEQS